VTPSAVASSEIFTTERSSVSCRSRCCCGSPPPTWTLTRRHSWELERIGEELSLALAELRELARGLHAAILTDNGLAIALESLAARPVVAEALTNVARYAQASGARVGVALDDGRWWSRSRTTVSAEPTSATAAVFVDSPTESRRWVGGST
jgi:hypothetical protein